MAHSLRITLLVLLFLSPLARGLGPLGHELGADSEAPTGWLFDAAAGSLVHEAGEARVQARNSRLLGVSGVVGSDPVGVGALVNLAAGVVGGGGELARALEHHLTASPLPAFTRIGNALLTLREDNLGLGFDLGLIEFAPGDFRGSRHVLNVGGSVPVRIFGDFASGELATLLLGVVPALEGQAQGLGVRLEYQHAPVSPVGGLAAEASECVAAAHPDGGFWVFAEALARERAVWALSVSPQAYFVVLAERLGLGAPGLAECVEGRLAQREVSVAREAATNLGLMAAPVVFVGGFLMSDPSDAAELERLIELARPVSPAAVGVGEGGMVPLAPGEGP